MRVAILVASLLCVIVAASLTEAHKSVRHIKPRTEEERSHHQYLESVHPPVEDGDEAFMKAHLANDEFQPLDHAHKSSRHKRWGPEHPNHIPHKQWHYKAPRMFEGEEIDDEIADEDLHLFGISKHNELQG